ncbi:MAG: translocation/assembly module TamB domain-containing protein [Kastovskya adunca ATA6-11-RM4]|nr:translocation/assembly module TamB domain-containing protein [Kastovskya adunca ATA6-11-RM4]
MTNPPNPGNEPETNLKGDREKVSPPPNPGNEPETNLEGDREKVSPRSSSRRRRLRRVGLAMGVLSLVGIGGGLAWAWLFVVRDLAPLVEKNLSETLNRPVQLGKVESFSFNSLYFGASKIPATPTDPDRVTMEAVQVKFDPLRLLFNRTLELDITLVEPNAYIEQDPEGRWISTAIQSSDEEGFISTELQSIRAKDAELALVSRQPNGKLNSPVVAFLPTAKARRFVEADDSQRFEFDLAGQLASSGEFKLAGTYLPENGRTNLQVSGQNLNGPALDRLLPLPLSVQAGTVDGELEVRLREDEPTLFLGNATLENVTARIEQLPQPFFNTYGQLRFKGTEIGLENVKTRLGQVPLVANGVVDTEEGYNLSALTTSVALPKVLQTFNIKEMPVEAAGEVQAKVLVTGPIEKPIVSGSVATTKVARVDRVNFRAISTNFRLVDSLLTLNNFQAQPVVGGQLTGQGQIQLGDKGSARFDVRAVNVPGGAIARNYNVDLPVPIGTVSGTAQINAPLADAKNLRAVGAAVIEAAGGTVVADNIQVVGERFRAQVRASSVQLSRIEQVPPRFQGAVSGDFILAGNLENLSQTLSGSGEARLAIAGGTVTIPSLQLADGRFRAQVRASSVQLGQLAEVPPQLRGPVSGNFEIAGNLENFSTETLAGRGAATLNVAGGTVTIPSVQLADGRFRAQVRASSVQLGQLAEVPPQLRGPVSGNFEIAGNLEDFSTDTLAGSGSASLGIGNGTVNAPNIQFANGRFTAQVRTSSVPVGRLAPDAPAQLRSSPLTGNFNIAGSLDDFSPSTLEGSGSGVLNVAGGTVVANNIQLDDGRFRAQVNASSVQLGQLAPVPPQLQGPVSGNLAIAGNLEDFSLNTLQGTGSGTAQVAGGTVALENIQLAQGRFSAIAEPTGVQLAEFSPELEGRLGGRLNISGSLDNLSPTSINARGQLSFSEGLALIDRPLTADITWTGQQLQIAQATAEGFDASGVVNVNPARSGLEAIQGFDLNVRAEDLDLQQLPAAVPDAVQLAGRADFDGRLEGTVAAPNIDGSLALRNFTAGGLEFESPLVGTVSAVPGTGVNLQLRGDQDQINLALGADYQPTAFFIQREDAIAQGTRSGEQLLVDVQNFPIATLKTLAPTSPIAAQPLSGELTGDLAINLRTREASGNVAIADPIFGGLQGDSFSGRFRYSDGVVALEDGIFRQGEGQYLLSGELIQTPRGPQFVAQLRVEEGQLQDVLTALQYFELDDLQRGGTPPTYGRAEDLQVASVGVPERPLQTQLRRLSEIEALLAQQRQVRDDSSPLPDLQEATGTFTGTVAVRGSLDTGITANFDIAGQDWKWGPYTAEQVIAEGNFSDGVLTFLPLRFQSTIPNPQDPEDRFRFVAFSGTIGGEEQSGQLQVRNVPIEQLQAFVQDVTNFPADIDFTGLLNATATVSGSINNPSARGVLSLEQATLDGTQVQDAEGSFSYNDARLNFNSEILVADADPLRINGSIPYRLPFATVSPDSNQLALNIDVQDEGLALLNLISRGQVDWVEGMGNVQLAISGTYDEEAGRPTELLAEGIATVENATIQAQALAEPLTDVTGTILFDLDNIRVENLRSSFSGGEITASGTLPISNAAAPRENPLRVNIGELAFNLKGLYSGGVRGDAVITGSVLEPVVGGEVELFDGRIQLAEGGGAPTSGGDTIPVGTAVGQAPQNDSPIAFDDLMLTLGEDVQITRAPILNFLVDGSLLINGTLNNIRPDGIISVKRGQVNLFTTQFRLARGYENRAEFSPAQGLDPTLDVRLVASVAEATQRRMPTDPLTSEIADVPASSLGRVQTVRVEARVEGQASRIADNIELTSDPSRSETEIVALLGGGFIDTLGRGDTTLGLANLAGSALLGGVQNIIGDTLGLSEFRLFPTLTTNEKGRSSTLGLGAEASVDLSQNLSVSALKVLTNQQPIQYGLRYRINDEILLRGSTDLSGDSRALVEYENRF